MALTQQEKRNRITRYSLAVIDGTIGTTLFPSVAMAQLILETGYMQHVVGNNLYGIKAAGAKTPYWDGSFVQAGTQEYVDGQPGNYSLKFRKYASELDSVKDRTAFLQTNGRYKNVFTATTPEAQCYELQKGGYATAPQYAATLVSIIKSWNLYELDKKKVS
jgi:flagellum-specific peptidoglycan hydrolase FlgJ